MTSFFPSTTVNNFTPQYNIAPTHNILTIVAHEDQWKVKFLRWGLIPSWAKQKSRGQPLINARQETLSEKSSFKNALANRRCLILADGFYEWNKNIYGKNPLYFHLANNELFAFAGLWELWQDQDGKIIESTTIINTSAQGIMSEIHPRMPIVLPPQTYHQWLDSNAHSFKDLNYLLSSNCQYNFSYYPVTQKVNFVTNNYPKLLIPEKVILTEQLSLF